MKTERDRVRRKIWEMEWEEKIKNREGREIRDGKKREITEREEGGNQRDREKNKRETERKIRDGEKQHKIRDRWRERKRNERN